MEGKDVDMEEEIKKQAVVEDAGIEYTAQEKLKEIPAEDLEAFTTGITERLASEDWKEQFYSIDDLRRLFKHHPTEFKKNLPNYETHIGNGVDNLRSSICKNSLTLVAEVFSTEKDLTEVDESGEPTPYAKFTNEILLTVSKRVADDKAFLSSLAKVAVLSIAKNCNSRSIIETLWELSRSKSIVIASESSNALAENCAHLKAEFCGDSDNLAVLFKTVSEDLASKRQPFSKNSKKILNSLKTVMGEEAMRESAKAALGSEDEVEKIMVAFLATKGKDSSKGFRDFLKKKKVVKQQQDDEVFIAE